MRKKRGTTRQERKNHERNKRRRHHAGTAGAAAETPAASHTHPWRVVARIPQTQHHGTGVRDGGKHSGDPDSDDRGLIDRPGHQRRKHAGHPQVRTDAVHLLPVFADLRVPRRKICGHRCRRLRQEPAQGPVRQGAGVRFHQYRPLLDRFDHHQAHHGRDQPAERIRHDDPHGIPGPDHGGRGMDILLPHQPIHLHGVPRVRPGPRHRTVRIDRHRASGVRTGLPYLRRAQQCGRREPAGHPRGEVLQPRIA